MNMKCVSIFLVLFMVAGCSGYKLRSQDRYKNIEVKEKKLKQIENLDLRAMQAKEKPKPEEIGKELYLSLEEVRAITLKNNLSLKVDLLNPVIARENVNFVEAGKYQMVFNAGINYSKTDSPYIYETISPGGKVQTVIVGNKNKNINTSLGVSLPLQTGGIVKADFVDSFHKRDGQDDVIDSPLSFSISQPLLKGAGRREFMHSIRIAEYDSQYVSASTRLAIINIISAADMAYWDLYKKRKVLEVRRQQYDLAKQQAARAKRFVAAGQNPEIEILRSQANLASQLRIIIAAENDLRRSQRNLKRILNKPGLAIKGPTILIPKTDADPLHNHLNREKLVKYAIDNRMELLQLELDIAKNLIDIEHLRNAALPGLSLDYSYKINGIGKNRGDAYDMVYDKKFENHRVGLNFVYPIGNKAAESNLQRALYSRMQKLNSRQDREILIQQEVLDALDGLETSWQQILANRQSAILNGRLYQAEQKQFEVGMRTSTEVLEAQANFADAQAAEYESLANYQIAMIELARATGTLPGAAKIQWEPAKQEIGFD